MAGIEEPATGVADGIESKEMSPDFVARLKPDVGTAVLDGETLLIEPVSGASHLLDAPGTLVVQCLDGSSTIAEIAADIAGGLGVDRAVVEEDVLTLLRTLGDYGLVAGIRRDEHAGHDHSRKTEGLPVGADLSGWDGWPEADAPTGATMLVNWGTNCGYCTRISADLAQLDAALRAADVELMLVTAGSEEALRAQVGETRLPVQHMAATPSIFQGLGTPVAYFVGSDGTVAEPLAAGFDQVLALARRLAATD